MNALLCRAFCFSHSAPKGFARASLRMTAWGYPTARASASCGQPTADERLDLWAPYRDSLSIVPPVPSARATAGTTHAWSDPATADGEVDLSGK